MLCSVLCFHPHRFHDVHFVALTVDAISFVTLLAAIQRSTFDWLEWSADPIAMIVSHGSRNKRDRFEFFALPSPSARDHYYD